MGLGTELLFILVLGLVVLGPKRLQMLLGHVAHAKAQFDEATRRLRTQLSAEIGEAPQEGKPDNSHELAGNE